MMSNHTLAWQLLAGSVAVCLAVILLGALTRFAQWLAVALWAQGLQLTEALAMGLIKGACITSGVVVRSVCGLGRIAGSLLASAAITATLPVKVRGARIVKVIREDAKLRQMYWKYGHTEFDSFAAFKRDVRGETPPQDEPPPPPPQTGSFADAQAVLGFKGDEPLTQTDLKLRFQKMIRLVHSDTGFPNTVFAQQLTEAVRVIKKVRKWK